jgi:hypothetical protein
MRVNAIMHACTPRLLNVFNKQPHVSELELIVGMQAK